MKFPIRRRIRHLSGAINRFLLPWAASFGLFVSTTNCPCCGQPACPAGAAGMGILAGVIAAVTGFFRRRCLSKSGTDLTCSSDHLCNEGCHTALNPSSSNNSPATQR